ncbi:sulfite exporter TauE/SafE family protein [Bacteroidota bacterium]
MGEKEKKNYLGFVFLLLGIVIAGYFLLRFVDGINMPEISTNMGYGLLFVVGLLTGFHCIGMCGGFVVSYSTKAAQNNEHAATSHVLYGVSKTLSYTIIGAAFGLLGSIIAFTSSIRGFVGIFAGLFLVLFGLKMLDVFPSLRRFGIRTPKFVSKFVIKNKRKTSNPIIIGLLNGLLIACGPLQAMYVLAAGTGSMIEGARLLFIFGLGTLPVLLGFGFLTSYLSHKATQKILKASGAIVIILGVIMINRGLALTGTGFDANTILTSVSASTNTPTANVIKFEGGYQVIEMNVTRYGWQPDKFVLQKDVPVKWVIDGQEINGCNNAIQVPKYGLNFDIKRGEQIIEFTPTGDGVIPWSCWMGMIPGTFIVKDDVDFSDTEAIQKELDNVPVQAGGSCGGGGSGGCGCGG